MSESAPEISDEPIPGLECVRDTLRDVWEEGKTSGITGRYNMTQLIEEARAELLGGDTRTA